MEWVSLRAEVRALCYAVMTSHKGAQKGSSYFCQEAVNSRGGVEFSRGVAQMAGSCNYLSCHRLI